jgi:hypothetical protein
MTKPFPFVELYEDIISQIRNLKMSKYYSDNLIIILAVVVVVGLLRGLLNLQHCRYHRYGR